MKFFVSYTTRDKEVSIELLSDIYDKLKKIGSVFIDIINNDSIDKQKRVFDELDSSDVLIVIKSQSIMDSYWVNLEIERAKSTDIKIYFFAIEEISEALNFGYLLSPPPASILPS